jgi:hypothetical protein
VAKAASRAGKVVKVDAKTTNRAAGRRLINSVSRKRTKSTRVAVRAASKAVVASANLTISVLVCSVFSKALLFHGRHSLVGSELTIRLALNARDRRK